MSIAKQSHSGVKVEKSFLKMHLNNNRCDQVADDFKCSSHFLTIIPPNEVKFTASWKLKTNRILNLGREDCLDCPVEAKESELKIT